MHFEEVGGKALSLQLGKQIKLYIFKKKKKKVHLTKALVMAAISIQNDTSLNNGLEQMGDNLSYSYINCSVFQLGAVTTMFVIRVF